METLFPSTKGPENTVPGMQLATVLLQDLHLLATSKV